ncbi:MAG TPA: zf-HC2 domain-containing protein [Bacteroidota bacterium]|nr:zf-HC2 domain-containing protein [Bacteroidota bacterium]
MKHQRYKEWLQLSLYQELNEHERSLLNDHLDGCPECREELNRLQKFHAIVEQYEPQMISEHELANARRSFRIRLHEFIEHPSWIRKVFAGIKKIFPVPVRFALGSVAILAASMVAGYVMFRSPAEKTFSIQPASMVQASYSSGEIQIANVKFDERDEQSGNVDFTFDAISPMHVHGNINDEHVQKILARALLNEQNPGMRLRTVDMIGSRTEQKPNLMNAEVKAALIAILKHDPNPGVRKQALEVLSNYLPDTAVTRAFLYVLANEKNTGLVINAINLLDVSKFEHYPISNELQQFLQHKVQSEGNQYVKIKATAALQEMQQ